MSTVEFVSKLSERLQQAALSSSPLLMFIIFAVFNANRSVFFCFILISIPSNSLVSSLSKTEMKFIGFVI